MRTDVQRLDDVVAAVAAIEAHLARGELADPLVFDAVRMRLIEVGEAIKDVDGPPRARADLSWRAVAGMRDHLAHRYFDADHTIIRATVENDLPPLVAAVTRLRSALAGEEVEG